ncbi:hypothetical protein VTO42DRAFT_7343 [Malbranchea cinnamomea]
MASDGFPPKLTLLEKLDLIPAQLSVLATAIYAALTGIFRGKSGAKAYGKHIGYAVIRRTLARYSTRQNQWLNPPTNVTYETLAKQKGFAPHTVKLGHGALGSWIGSKDAKNIVVYYHGGGFAVPAGIAYLQFLSDIADDLRTAGKDVAIFIVTYSLTPHAVYPTQFKQAVAALRYILEDLKHPPANVFIGGDSAGGNLTFAVLSHTAHPHPEIEPLQLSEPLGGAFAMAPWASFRQDFLSMKENIKKDMLMPETLKLWSDMYLAGQKEDNYNQPALAPADWWSGIKVNRIMVVAGSDEVLLGGIEEFLKKLKAGFPNTTYIVVDDEPHVAPIIFRMLGGKDKSGQDREIRSWLSARL